MACTGGGGRSVEVRVYSRLVILPKVLGQTVIVATFKLHIKVLLLSLVPDPGITGYRIIDTQHNTVSQG